MSSVPLRRWRPQAFATPAATPAAAPAEELEARRREAEQAGFAAGHAAGLAAARAEVERLRALFGSADRALALFEERLAGELLDLAIEIARQVIRGEIATRRETVLAPAREALAMLAQEARAVEIHVHPADAELLRQHLADELARGGWRVLEDPRIEPGGVRLASSSGEVDATVATRWRRVLAALGQDHPWRDEPA
ncbi:MAG: flagellar assembly protein FliH [Burkholderiales bacterium]|nr:flagellar assembly protein FliH [Burkholderiales bacterium]